MPEQISFVEFVILWITLIVGAWWYDRRQERRHIRFLYESRIELLFMRYRLLEWRESFDEWCRNFDAKKDQVNESNGTTRTTRVSPLHEIEMKDHDDLKRLA